MVVDGDGVGDTIGVDDCIVGLRAWNGRCNRLDRNRAGRIDDAASANGAGDGRADIGRGIGIAGAENAADRNADDLRIPFRVGECLEPDMACGLNGRIVADGRRNGGRACGCRGAVERQRPEDAAACRFRNGERAVDRKRVDPDVANRNDIGIHRRVRLAVSGRFGIGCTDSGRTKGIRLGVGDGVVAQARLDIDVVSNGQAAARADRSVDDGVGLGGGHCALAAEQAATRGFGKGLGATIRRRFAGEIVGGEHDDAAGCNSRIATDQRTCRRYDIHRHEARADRADTDGERENIALGIVARKRFQRHGAGGIDVCAAKDRCFDVGLDIDQRKIEREAERTAGERKGLRLGVDGRVRMHSDRTDRVGLADLAASPDARQRFDRVVVGIANIEVDIGGAGRQ
ncbi:hypothetical protein D9M68_362820 [compost metagenome]